jgi:hypothetical protein
MYVMTIDQRGSTGDADRVPDLISQIAELTSGAFERSVGDELQGVVSDPAEVVDIALHALRAGRWYVGIGVGAVSLPAGASPREGTGTGFVAARHAVDRAKAAGSQVPLSVVPGIMGKAAGGRAGDTEGVSACANAEGVLRLLGRLVQERTDAQWRVVDALRRQEAARHGRQKQVALELGISEQSVSRTVLRSGWQEEWAARPAAAMLLDYAHSSIAGSTIAHSKTAGSKSEGA